MIYFFSNSNWTEWSKIQGAITQVISKLDKHKCEANFKVQAQLLPDLYETESNY